MHRSPLALVTLALIVSTADARAQAPGNRPSARDTTRVVFVCEHGSVKSMIAATLFNRLAMERGLAAHAVSRGTAPDSVIPRLVRDGLRADGANIGNIRPQGLRTADTLGANMFVTFDVDLRSPFPGAIPVRRWDGTPSVMQAYPAGRDAIRSRVVELISEMQRAAPGPAGRNRRLP